MKFWRCVTRRTEYSDEIRWMLSSDTGLSSMTIWAVMMDSTPQHPSIPYDPGDFGRCHRLLTIKPGWLGRLHEVASRYPEWGPFVREWDYLTELYCNELRTGRCPKLYERMKELRKESQALTGDVL